MAKKKKKQLLLILGGMLLCTVLLAVCLTKDAEDYLIQGNTFMEESRFEEAIEAYQEAIPLLQIVIP